MEETGVIFVLGVFVGLKRILEEIVWFCFQQYCSSEKNGQAYLRY